MTNGIRRTGFYGVAGVLLASIIIVGFVTSNNLFVSGIGTLTIRIMDKPVQLEGLYLTIEEVRIQHEDEKWITIETEIDEFDLLALQEEEEAIVLSENLVPAGGYSKIWLYVSEPARAIYLDGNEQPQTIFLNVPSGIVKIFFNPSFTVVSNGNTMVLIDLQPVELGSIGVSTDGSFSENTLNLRPVIKAIVSTQLPESTAEPSPAPS